MSQASSVPLVDRYAGLVCDLDGVVYRGSEAIAGAIDTLTTVLSSVPLVFATNNASRTPDDVATQLQGLGLDVGAAHVVTSAQGGAAYLCRDLKAGARVLAVGGEGVRGALAAAGLTPVLPGDLGATDSAPAAILQGWGLDVTVRDLAAVCRALASGARWVATNTDVSLPVDGGVDIPGNGTLVGAVTAATRQTPEIVGKPHRPLYEHAAAVLGVPADRSLAIGDRLETDILGAEATGMDSLWVLTGVDGFVELLASATTPTFAAAGLDALTIPAIEVCRDGTSWSAGDIRATRVAGGRLDIGPSMVGSGDTATGHAAAHEIAMVGLAVVLDVRDDVRRGVLTLDAATEIARTLDSLLRETRGTAGQ